MHDRVIAPLLEPLYGMVTQPQRKYKFLAALSKATGAHVSGMFEIRIGPDGSICKFTCNFGDPAVEEIFSKRFPFCEQKLWFDRSREQTRTGSVLNGYDYASTLEVKNSGYYADLLRLIDAVHAIGLCGLQAPSAFNFITPCRNEASGAFGQSEMAVLRALSPHFTNVIELQGRLRQADATLGTELALFRFDTSWQCYPHNDAGRELLAKIPWLRLDRGALRFLDSSTQQAWVSRQQATRHRAAVVQSGFPVRDGSGRLIAMAKLHSPAPTPLGAHALFVRPLASLPDAGLGPVLRDAFGLTQAESQFAVALKFHADIAQAAEALGISAATARQRLQIIYEKTGVHRQSQLLRAFDALAGMPSLEG